MDNKLISTLNETILNYKKAANMKAYQFEKNKLYDFIGADLVSTLKRYKCFIAGGTITSLFTNSKINDLDIYFRSEKLAIDFVKEVWEESGDWINMLTRKALLIRLGEKEIQAIHFKYYNSAEEIFQSFDFTVCMGAFDFESEQFVLHEDFLKHNSQRILKFNKQTDFPVVSLLRVHKYNGKRYTISKPEFLRIAMKCMELSIQNVDELKSHLGGMYGINLDKLIVFEEGEKFSLDIVIDKIEHAALDEDYFKKPEEVKFDDLDDIIDQICKKEMKITVIKDKVYKICYDNSLKYLPIKPAYYTEVEGKTYIESKKFYKFVKKINDNTYASHRENSFLYKIGEISTAKNEHLYLNEKMEIDASSYRYEGSLIEVEVVYNDFHYKNNKEILVKSCKVIREVPKSEYSAWMSDEEEEEEEMEENFRFSK